LKDAGLESWSGLAESIGVSRGLICHVRAGRAKMSPRVRGLISQKLRVPPGVVDELLLRAS
jgi:hypothetical protein